MKKKPIKATVVQRDNYDAILKSVVELLEGARRSAARAVNTVITSAYWEIGRRIVESEMAGKSRADYGERLIDRLSGDLTERFGRGFSRRAVYQMRAFYLAYPEIVQSTSAQLEQEGVANIVQSAIAQSSAGSDLHFPLPWAHYVRLLSVDNAELTKTRKQLESRPPRTKGV